MDKNDYIFGTRAVIEAIKNNRTIDKVFIKKGLSNELFQELYDLMQQNRVAYQFVPLEKINRITRKNHQGVIAMLSPVEFYHIETILPGLFETGVDPFILVLDQITDVRNFGAIVRSAECAGIHAIVIPEKGMAAIGADAVKTSAGAIHHMPICRVVNLPKTVRYLKESGVKIVAATEKSDNLYTQVNLNTPLAIVVGSEEDGISAAILEIADERVKIPILGKIESLNVSVAAALMIYEAVRQKNQR